MSREPAAQTFRLDTNARTLTLPEDRKYFFPQTGDPEATAYLAAAFLIKFGVMPTQEVDRIDLGVAMPREELYALLGGWIREHQLLTDVEGKIARVQGRALSLKSKGVVTNYTLPAGIPAFVLPGSRRYSTWPLPMSVTRSCATEPSQEFTADWGATPTNSGRSPAAVTRTRTVPNRSEVAQVAVPRSRRRSTSSAAMAAVGEVTRR